MGISKAGFKSLGVFERDRYCCDTIRENQQSNHPIVSLWPLEPGDVKVADFKRFEGKIDLVSGGPPCQPFSLGGKHKGRKDARDLWPEAVRAVREARPRAFIFENVKGLTREAFATYFQYIVLQLSYPEIMRREKDGEKWDEHLSRLEQHHTSRRSNRGLSYRVVFRVLNAANYGVPQKRERVFFVGFRNDISAEWHFPEPTHSLDALLREQIQTGVYWERHRVPRAQRAISDRARARGQQLSLLPDDDTRPWLTIRDAIHDMPAPTIHGSNRYLNHRLQLGARSYPGHTGSPIDEPSKTLKAGVHGVPGGENTVLFPDGKFRYLSVRESARLQKFPDDFVFHGSWSETMRQLGNAVPVALAHIIASSVREHLALSTGGNIGRLAV
ncbi:DNA cytosine methyltransferase [Bradyrhizobium japonicum]|nr:DNA cytosine methyltransferase [Bradyrhizobium japonicum]